MCGISLIWDERSPAVARARLAQAMAETIRHRGPDGHGLWADPGAPLAIAHRRLAIQGLGEQGAQPMVHPGGNARRTHAVRLQRGKAERHSHMRGGSDLKTSGSTGPPPGSMRTAAW